MLLAAVATVSLVACGSSGTNADPDTAQASSGDASAPELLQFTAPLVGGGEFNGASYAGRPVMFWFWAPT